MRNPLSLPGPRDREEKVNIDFPLTGSKALISALMPLPKGQKFHFVCCSGQAGSRDLEKKQWFFNDARKIKVAVFSLPLSQESLKQSLK
jgi:hypothetical protein